MWITINRNTIIKFSRKAWIAPTIKSLEVMHRYNSLNRSIEHLGKLKDQEDLVSTKITPYNNNQTMLEVWVSIQEHNKLLTGKEYNRKMLRPGNDQWLTRENHLDKINSLVYLIRIGMTMELLVMFYRLHSASSMEVWITRE